MAIMSRRKKAVSQGWENINKQRAEEARKRSEEFEKQRNKKVSEEEHKKRIEKLKEIGLLTNAK